MLMHWRTQDLDPLYVHLDLLGSKCRPVRGK